MQVKVIDESGYNAALLGLGLSYGKTSDMSLDDFECEGDEVIESLTHIALKLAGKGNAHNKFLRQIQVVLDITAPLYWWKQADTYKIGTVAQSESTMHTICAKPFTIDDFELDHPDSPFVRTFIGVLNSLRIGYLESENEAEKKIMWRDLIQYLPESYIQRRIVTCNYEVLRCIFKQRHGHKLGEWRTFINEVYKQIKKPEFVSDIYYA